ncbi:MAG: hypothetical protein ACK4VI_09475 [Alphaproteobacteria bacterium]
MQACDEDIQTPEQREEAMERLAEAVFFQFAEHAIDKPSTTFDNQSPREFVRQGIEEYRQVEEFLLSHASEIKFGNEA